MAGQDEKREPTGGRTPEAEQRATTAPKTAKLVFSDPLSRPSRDDTDAGWGDSGSGGRDLDWYLSQRPPHHGG
ncbi:hypothetical protein ACIGXM_08365 [Kitasatospora sp. NPDC052896]|uniref:hypothetical protein n=1 Tax=Kitasatospora sp. NPDC052896 TaxID=3364061 RepID=UPI0037C8BBEB